MEKISIRPILRFVPVGLFLVLLVFLFIVLAVGILSILFSWGLELGDGDIQPIYIIGIIVLPYLIMYVTKETFYQIIFIEDTLVAPKLSEGVQKSIRIECPKLIKYSISSSSFRNYFVFTCIDGKKHKLFINHFTKRQRGKIILMIQERGGLLDYDLNKIL